MKDELNLGVEALIFTAKPVEPTEVGFLGVTGFLATCGDDLSDQIFVPVDQCRQSTACQGEREFAIQQREKGTLWRGDGLALFTKHVLPEPSPDVEDLVVHGTVEQAIQESRSRLTIAIDGLPTRPIRQVDEALLGAVPELVGDDPQVFPLGLLERLCGTSVLCVLRGSKARESRADRDCSTVFPSPAG